MNSYSWTITKPATYCEQSGAVSATLETPDGITFDVWGPSVPMGTSRHDPRVQASLKQVRAHATLLRNMGDAVAAALVLPLPLKGD